MSRNGANVYSKPAGTTFVPNTVIESAKVNEVIDDIAADLNLARPIVAGGTGASTAIAAGDNLSTKGADIASATTTDIGAATGRYINITGTTTITGLGTKTAGVVRICTFTGSLTLTHNATSLILPGGANIQTAANDVAVFVSEGSGNWRCVNYIRASLAFVDVASASTTNIGAAASDCVRITGTTTITSFGTVAAGIYCFVRMEGALTLTHNGTSLILPNGGQNITTAANDCFLAKSLGSGNWLVMHYQKATPSIIMGSSTQTATGSETALSFPIPSGVETIEISFVSFSTNGTNVPVIRLSNGGAYASTSYLGSVSNISSGVASGNHSNGFLIANSITALNTAHGKISLRRASGNTWEIEGGLGMSDTAFNTVVRGSRVMGGEVDGVQVNTASANTIDSGSIVTVKWYR